MITILASLKPFSGDVAQIQDNALSNWLHLNPTAEVILYGEGEGVSERAKKYNAIHVPHISCNGSGVPDFSAVVEHASIYARFDVQVYVNGDILLPPDFVYQIKQVLFKQYMVIGQRIDLSRNASFDHLSVDWESEIWRCYLAGEAKMHGPSGMDYFVFPRGLWQKLHPLIIGRGGYDNALVAYCLRRRIPIVDATQSIHAVHQWHDYSHLGSIYEVFAGVDAIANWERHDIKHSSPNIDDADWKMINGKILPRSRSTVPFRGLEITVRYRWRLKYISYLVRVLTRVAWLFGWPKPRPIPLETVIRQKSGQGI